MTKIRDTKITDKAIVDMLIAEHGIGIEDAEGVLRDTWNHQIDEDARLKPSQVFGIASEYWEQLKSDPNVQTDKFEYKPHENLIDNTAEQVRQYLGCSLGNARGRVEQAMKFANTDDSFADARDWEVTGKVDWKIIANLAVGPYTEMMLPHTNEKPF